MGVVYRATHRLLQQPRALKVPQPRSASDETFLKLFYREARLAASLKHPGIVRVFDVGEADGQHYLAMALLDGRPLHRLLRTDGSMPARRAATIVRQLADALDYAHARKILHRDVKPSNVFVDVNDQVTLLDFGIARAMDGTSSSGGITLGTAAYMAPELFEGQAATPASDGYALAILAFELLCGKTPFGDMTPHAMGYAHTAPDDPATSYAGPHQAASAYFSAGDAGADLPTGPPRGTRRAVRHQAPSVATRADLLDKRRIGVGSVSGRGGWRG
jgi:serine/threonine-protein kinase